MADRFGDEVVFAVAGELALVDVRRGSSCEVSARFFATYAGGYAVWLLYGLSIGSLPLILVDAAGLLCGLVTLAVTLSMRGSLLRPRTWVRCPERRPA